jgi:curved DNA-binding protein CbpA
LSGPISIKLRCASWGQLASIYKRDLARNAIFLRSANPPPLGTAVRIDLTLPSESMVVLTGTIARHVGESDPDPGLAGRGAGVDVRLNTIPQSAMWLIETALSSAQKEGSTVGRPPTATPAKPTPTVAVREPTLNEGADLAAAETELIVALTSELDSLKRLNPFQVLGLGYEANDADVRAAFGELTKRYHPDRYARFQSTDLRNLAAEIFILIRDAYRRIGDEAGRAQTLAQLQRRSTTPAQGTPPPRAASAPPVPVPKPQVLPKVSVPPVPAPRAETPPPELTPPPEASSGANQSMAESMLDGGKYDEALAFFKILARKNPNDRQAKAGIELAEGLRAMAMRDRLEAAQRFEAALELDPANERAARELAEMRRLATNERKGMLSRLLGKKE